MHMILSKNTEEGNTIGDRGIRLSADKDNDRALPVLLFKTHDPHPMK